MRSVILTQPGSLALDQTSEPKGPDPHEALVQVRRIGVCGTDYHAYGGNQNFFRYPRVLGHELAVTVISTGADVTNVSSGDDCAVLPYVSCGECVACRRDRTNCCERLNVLGVMIDGGMRDRFTIPASLLFAKPDLDLDTLAMIEPLGVGYHAVNRSQISDGDFALVIGAGPIGLAIAQAASARGADIVIADNDPARLELARDLQGTATLDPDAPRDEQLRTHGAGELPTIVFDATGNVASMESTPDLVSPSGSIVFVGHTTSDLCLHNPTLHLKEVSIHTSRAAQPSEWIDLLDLVSKGTLSPTGWIGTRCELAEVPSVFPSWIEDRGTIVKAMIEVESSGSDLPGGTT